MASPRRLRNSQRKTFRRSRHFRSIPFEVLDDHISITDPASSSELEEGEDDRKAEEEEGRQATVHSLHIREQALRLAHAIALDRAISKVKTERKEYLGKKDGRR